MVTACGVAFPFTRDQVRQTPWLTIWRGDQTCPECPHELDELPEAVRWLLMPNGIAHEHEPGFPIHVFAQRYTDALITLVAESKGVSRIEAIRQYETNAQFHTMVDMLVHTACRVIQTMDVQEAAPAYREAFSAEVADLLGWEH